MNSFLNPDNRVMQFITKLVSCVYLNILWLICCIPIVTAGASTSALFYVTLKMAKNKEGSITNDFFSSFRTNFKQGTKIWLILLGIGIILGIDGYVLFHIVFENVFWTFLTAVFAIAVVAYLIVLMYIFPLLAYFNSPIVMMFKNSIMIGMRFLFCTVLMAVIYFVMAFVVIHIFTPAIIFGQGLCAFLCSYFLSSIFHLCKEKSEEHHAGSI